MGVLRRGLAIVVAGLIIIAVVVVIGRVTGGSSSSGVPEPSTGFPTSLPAATP